MVLPNDIRFDARERYVHQTNLSESTLKLCSTKHYWKGPLRSVHWLHNQLEQRGGTPYFTYLVQYRYGDLVKVFFDIEKYSHFPIDIASCKAMVREKLLEPFFRWVNSFSGSVVDMANVAATDYTRKMPEGDPKAGMYKFSMHIFINNVTCRAECLKHIITECNFEDILTTAGDHGCMDPNVYDITSAGGRRILRLVGATKVSDDTTYSVPCSVYDEDFVTKPNPPPFQDYVVTYTTGNEVDVSEKLKPYDERPASRPCPENREVDFSVRAQRRQLVRAAYLDQYNDDQLATMASTELSRRHIDTHHAHSKLIGNRIWYECGPSGRKCFQDSHQDRNRAYVEFRRSGEMHFYCLSSKCASKCPVKLGHWAKCLDDLLFNNVWMPAEEVDGRLLDTVYNLASAESGSGNRARRHLAMADQPWFLHFEDTIARYMSHHYVFIKEQSMFIEKYLGADGEMVDFRTFAKAKLSDHTKPFDWAFKLWEASTYRLEKATLDQFVAEPFAKDVPPKAFNLCAKAMPLLETPYLQPTAEEIAEIQPLLDHILASLVSGDQQDYDSFMGWLAHVVKHPNKKIGWMPFFIGEQGSGKGIILGGLMVKMFDKLGLHATNFGSVTGQFNSDLMLKCLVFIGKKKLRKSVTLLIQ